MNKKQTNKALQLLRLLSAESVPNVITYAEASRLCDRFGVETSRFHRCPERDRHSRPARLIDVVAVISKATA